MVDPKLGSLGLDIGIGRLKREDVRGFEGS